MRRMIVGLASSAALGAGLVAGGALLPVNALKQEPLAAGTSRAAQSDDGCGLGRGRVLRVALADLVADGTLTQDQADAVGAEVVAELDERRGGERRDRGRRGARMSLEVAAEAIGISYDELCAELTANRTIAEVADAHDVDPQAVIDALVAAGNERIDEAVADGRLSEERAERLRERLADAAERLVHR